MFSTFKLVMVGILISSLAGAGLYVMKLRSDNAILKANQIKLEEAVSSQQKVIEQQKADFETIMAANKKLQETRDILQRELQNLDDKFNKTNASGKKRDIGDLAVNRPESVERVINRASDNALRCVEIAMGAPLTEKEINAVLPSEINSECPSLANPNYVSTQ
jgi:predicted metal-dependent hydrolase|tara:strand:+ start:414 stop:902 length:489 start_codon:yes stop_codon:yes gene_type:complete